MRRLIVLFLPLLFLYAPTQTFYSDWDWGYYFWLFGPVGPNHSQGMAAAGYSSLEYRGYNQFTLSSYPGAGTQISTLTLRLRNNTGGAGLQIDVNRVLSNTPDWDECGGTAPIYLTNQAVSSNAEEYTYIDLTGTQAVDDLINAWQTSSWFGLGYKGSRGSGEPCMHFFYAFWADYVLDAALIVDYMIVGKQELENNPGEFCISVYPNPCEKILYIDISAGLLTDVRSGLAVYDVLGKPIKELLAYDIYRTLPAHMTWDRTDQMGLQVPAGVYFIELRIDDGIFREKIILIH